VLKAPDIPVDPGGDCLHHQIPTRKGKLRDDAYQDQLADAIVSGIRRTSRSIHRWRGAGSRSIPDRRDKSAPYAGAINDAAGITGSSR